MKNTYFGFTKGIKPMQAGKIEKSLDMLVRYNGKIMTEKEFVYLKLQEGYVPSFEENYSYWSRKTEEMTKPKTRYKLDSGDQFQEINKTLYNYALHILNNGLLNEQKVNDFINNELKQKEEFERLIQDKLKKEREEQQKQREQEEKERQERLQQKQNEWRKNGSELMTNETEELITNVLNGHWNDIEKIYPETNKEIFYTDMIEKFILLLGNKDYVIHLLQYYVEKENESNYNKLTIKTNPSMTIERDVLISLCNINMNDKNTTITSKVKAFYNGKEYKGRTA